MYAKCGKRILDVIVSLTAVIILSPILLLLTVLGSFFMRGNPFFIQERPGKDEKIFKLIKFRSMNQQKDSDGKPFPDEVRLNSYGRFLRKTSLDELPELFNIIKGDMSIVGPRPLLVEYLPFYTEEEKQRHSVRPGLSGLAQVSGRNFLAWNERLQKDVEYVRNITFKGDIKIIFLTVFQVIRGSDVVEDTGTIETNLAREREENMQM